ncbi:hypothetical protein HKX48_006970 [Thoreauomyces humboldtii]|nr:hypothetical protein HKX48_006970 [Thoreauomyces humboldtii]
MSGVVQAIERRSLLEPDATALLYIDVQGNVQRWSYGKVWIAARTVAARVAASLSKRRTTSNRGYHIVGMLVDEGPLLPIAELAVLMTGSCLLPMDWTDPRLHYVLEDACVDLVIAKDDESVAALARAVDKAPGNAHPLVVRLQELQSGDHASLPSLGDLTLSEKPIAGDDVALLFFTSGSTGRPKGCLTKHSALKSYCDAKNATHQVDRTSTCFVASAVTFDPSVGDFLSSWMAGAAIASGDRKAIFTMLGECLKQTDSTHLLTTPSLFDTLQGVYGPAELPRLRTLALGGEPMSAETVQTWAAHVRLMNTYGVTECCVYQAYAVVSPGTSRKALGKPLPGNTLYVMTNRGEIDRLASCDHKEMDLLLPKVGEIGELWIGGSQVGLGYLNQAELTGQKFVDHPSIGRCYRTGDVVKCTDDASEKGEWRLIGRLDSMVKIRGQRVDVMEVENALVVCATSVLLTRTAVVFHQETKQLVAFVVPRDASAYVNSSSRRQRMLVTLLRSLCSRQLPPHMVPSRFVVLTDLPKTTTGKVARSQLSRHTLPLSETVLDGETFAPSHGGWTRLVRTAWELELGVPVSDRIGAHFIELGGDSLGALRVCKRIADVRGPQEADANGFGELLGPLGPAELLRRPHLEEYASYLQGAFGSLVIDGKAEAEESTASEREREVAGALHVAAGAGATSVVDFLLQSGRFHPDGEPLPSDERTSNEQRTTPLHCACLNGHVQTAQLLIARGATVTTTDQTGATALHLASHSGPKALISALLDHLANTLGSATMKRIPPAARVDLNRQTPLHHAARSGAPSGVIDLLLTFGASLEAKDAWGRTCLHWAVVNGHRNAVATLLEHGADARVADDAGETCLEIAERRARCGAQERGAGIGASVFGDIAKLLGGSGATKSVGRFLRTT